MSHSTNTNESRYTCYLEYAGVITSERVMAHIKQSRHVWMSHGTNINESWHTYYLEYAGVRSHMRESSRGTHELVTAYMDESLRVYE